MLRQTGILRSSGQSLAVPVAVYTQPKPVYTDGPRFTRIPALEIDLNQEMITGRRFNVRGTGVIFVETPPRDEVEAAF